MTPTRRRRSVMAALPLGIAAMAAIDEIVFHQLLAWHHFFDRATPVIALFSDGLLHSAELILMVLGVFLFARLWQERAVHRRAAQGGFLLGMGGFQLFDGIVDHKILGIHQIRYVENLWIYDLCWNGVAFLLLLAGAVLVRRAGRA